MRKRNSENEFRPEERHLITPPCDLNIMATFIERTGRRIPGNIRVYC